MTSFHYIHLDVFTDSLFAGNQLAVFPVAQGLADRVMQEIAREINFSETTFVLPPERPDTDIRLRIFTPTAEIPMAGHPTVGTAFALAHTGFVKTNRESVVFGEGVGPVPVALRWKGAQLDFAWMTQPLPRFGGTVDAPAEAARALGLKADALFPGLPVQEISSGDPFLYVPLRSRELVDRATLDREVLVPLCAKLGRGELPVFLFSPPEAGDEATVYSRMFAPGFGIPEDPATGGASGPLGAFLVRHGVVPRERAGQILNLQGVKMGRPSWIYVDIGLDGNDIIHVKVGGQAVIAAEGQFSVND